MLTCATIPGVTPMAIRNVLFIATSFKTPIHGLDGKFYF